MIFDDDEPDEDIDPELVAWTTSRVRRLKRLYEAGVNNPLDGKPMGQDLWVSLTQLYALEYSLLSGELVSAILAKIGEGLEDPPRRGGEPWED